LASTSSSPALIARCAVSERDVSSVELVADLVRESREPPRLNVREPPQFDDLLALEDVLVLASPRLNIRAHLLRLLLVGRSGRDTLLMGQPSTTGTCWAYGCCEPAFTDDGLCAQQGDVTHCMRLFLYGPGGGFDRCREQWARSEHSGPGHTAPVENPSR
jgi:hypothetical protein